MKTIPTLPESAPFSTEQRAWLNGFLAGLLYDLAAESAPDQTGSRPAAPAPLLIGFGSQTGTAQGLAKRLAKEAEKHGFAPKIKELNAIAPAELSKEPRFIVISSTWGDGEPPDNATQFWSALSDPSAPPLAGLEFAVLGLGDKNYSDYCGASKKFDERLAALGAKRLMDRGECDVDYEATANAWIALLWPKLTAQKGEPPQSANTPQKVSQHVAAPEAAPGAAYSRNNPFPARLKTNRRLNREGSAKDTRHFEIVLEGSNVAYEVGDALGVMPKNCPVLVEELLATLGFKGEERVRDASGKESNLHQALVETWAITQAPLSLIKDAATRSENSGLLPLLEPSRKADFDAWLRGRDIVDVLKACPKAVFTPEDFTAHLRKLQPRLYSISSSPKAHPGEVHLTIAAVRYEAHGRIKKGVASCWLADRVIAGESPVPVFVQTSHGFRLPADSSRPVIMIGPGTGIAPFRAFLEDRRATGATGKNWLFFGDQCRATDFLYEEEIVAWQSDGLLARADLAFSRDQKEKIYVQNRMIENARELWAWLEAGAHLYVCGDAKRMAKDVDTALHEVISIAGTRTADQAAEYVASMKSDKRYQRDVY